MLKPNNFHNLPRNVAYLVGLDAEETAIERSLSAFLEVLPGRKGFVFLSALATTGFQLAFINYRR